MISFSDLRFRYPEGKFELNIPDLTLADGETVAVIWPSGSDTTTLLHPMAGARPPPERIVVTDDVEVTEIAVVVPMSVTFVGALTALTAHFASTAVRLLVLQ
jgi:ABC-type thiamine transport system ATPase subunit